MPHSYSGSTPASQAGKAGPIPVCGFPRPRTMDSFMIPQTGRSRTLLPMFRWPSGRASAFQADHTGSTPVRDLRRWRAAHTSLHYPYMHISASIVVLAQVVERRIEDPHVPGSIPGGHIAPVAQRSEPRTHNPSVDGSNPSGSIEKCRTSLVGCRLWSLKNPTTIGGIRNYRNFNEEVVNLDWRISTTKLSRNPYLQ